jgi:hypothetical protein
MSKLGKILLAFPRHSGMRKYTIVVLWSSVRIALLRNRFLFVLAAPRSTNAFHDEVGSRGLVEKGKLFSREDVRKDKSADGDESEYENWEAYGGDGLSNGKSGAKADEFDEDEVPDSCASANSKQGARSRCESAVSSKEDELGGDAIALESLDTHDKE